MEETNKMTDEQAAENDAEPGEFTAYCNKYYRLTVKLAEQEESLAKMLSDAPAYTGQTRLIEIDAIIRYYREVQAANAEAKATAGYLADTGKTIRSIMAYFEIPPGTILTGEIPGELEYAIWAADDDNVYIRKTKQLAPLVLADNVIVIQLSDL